MRALRTPEDGTLFGEQVGQRFEQLRTTILGWQAEDQAGSTEH